VVDRVSLSTWEDLGTGGVGEGGDDDEGGRGVAQTSSETESLTVSLSNNDAAAVWLSPPCCFTSFLYLLRRFWNQIFTYNHNAVNSSSHLSTAMMMDKEICALRTDSPDAD